jgi:hypothetical protein
MQEYQNYLDAEDDIKSVVLEDFKELALRLAFTFGVAQKKTRNALITLVHSGIMYAAEDVPANLHFLSGLPRFVSSLASQTTAKYMYALSLSLSMRVECGVSCSVTDEPNHPPPA